MGHTLFRRSFNGGLSTCLSKDDAYLALAEVCKVGDKMKWTLYRQKVYWPTMIKDCMENAKSCEECQKHANIQRIPASELHLIVKPWPF